MPIRALFVMPHERRLPLLEHLEARNVEVITACGCEEARRVLGTGPPVQVVLTDTTLPDGNWRTILEEIARSQANAELVVCARAVDASLCAEVFKRGAYDLLIEPYEKQEVNRVLQAAAARTYMRSLGGARAPVRTALG